MAAVVGLNVPAGQTVHAALPFLSLYVPAGHGKHGAPAGPVYPGLHKQAETLLAEGELELAGQERQTVAVAKSIRRTSSGRVAM